MASKVLRIYSKPEAISLKGIAIILDNIIIAIKYNATVNIN